MEVWERLPEETPKAYYHFTIYRDMGPNRSLTKVCQQETRAPGYKGQLEKWSKLYSWVNRAQAWDMYLDQEARDTRINAVREMAERHTTAAMTMMTRALQRLRNLQPEELSPQQVRLYLTEAAKMERLARGEPETITEERRQPTDEWEQDIIDAIIADGGFMGALQKSYESAAGENYQDVGPGRMDQADNGRNLLEKTDHDSPGSSSTPESSGSQLQQRRKKLPGGQNSDMVSKKP